MDITGAGSSRSHPLVPQTSSPTANLVTVPALTISTPHHQPPPSATDPSGQNPPLPLGVEHNIGESGNTPIALDIASGSGVNDLDHVDMPEPDVSQGVDELGLTDAAMVDDTNLGAVSDMPEPDVSQGVHEPGLTDALMVDGTDLGAVSDRVPGVDQPGLADSATVDGTARGTVSQGVDKPRIADSVMAEGTALGAVSDQVQGVGDMDKVVSDHAEHGERVGDVDKVMADRVEEGGRVGGVGNDLGSDVTPTRDPDSLESGFKDLTMADTVTKDPRRLVAGLQGKQFPLDAEMLYWPALAIHTYLPWLHKQRSNSPVSPLIMTNAPLFICV
jgi:hypothetical protein